MHIVWKLNILKEPDFNQNKTYKTQLSVFVPGQSYENISDVSLNNAGESVKDVWKSIFEIK